MNILYYSPDPAYPVKSGNRARICELIKAFQRMGHTVHFAVLNSAECTPTTVELMRTQLNTSVDLIPSKTYRISLGRVRFDGWYSRGVGERVAALCEQYSIDMVICSYVHQSKVLEYLPPHILKVIDTHDVMGNRSAMLRANGLPPLQFSCTENEEAAYLRRADVVLAITEEEQSYFNRISGRDHAITVSHAGEPRFINKTYGQLRDVGIIASSNFFNLTAIQQFLEQMNAQMVALKSPPLRIHLFGDIKRAVALRRFFNPKMKLFKKTWLTMHGFVPNIADIYNTMDLMISPMLCGTGINIKTVEAMAYGIPLLTTRHASRGIEITDPMHQHETLEALVTSLLSLHDKPQELARLAALSRAQYLSFYKKNNKGLEQLFKFIT